MQQAQVVTYGVEDVLAERLRELAHERRFWLRETSQFDSCEQLLHSAPPKLLVLVLGRDLEGELRLVERVHATLPGTAILVVGEADNPVLESLALELGATCTLFPPLPMERIKEMIVPYLETADS